MNRSKLVLGTLLVLLALIFELSYGYSSLEDARIIAQYKLQLQLNHAKIARSLVHQADWASVGSLSTNPDVLGYPMVNIISIDDNNENGDSTGKIHFLLTDLDFTGPDWRESNKVTFLFTDEQPLNCQHAGKDPMEPTCARTMISGQVKVMDIYGPDYPNALHAFKSRHPASDNWISAHNFYLCELVISNIFVLDAYGGPHKVTPEEYYSVTL